MKPRTCIHSAITFVLALFFVTAPCLASSGLAASGQAASGLPPFDPAHIPAAPDYAQHDSWLALPDNPEQHPVDIFWVYPTILADKEHWLMDKTIPAQSRLAANTLIKQASIFDNQANLYAPYYRQMNMAGLSLPQEDIDKLMQYGLGDVWRAFNHYLKHHNQGRPFILAGHSQGSNLLVDLAIQHWGTIGVEKRMVAAYLIGWSITPDDLQKNPNLSICSSANQNNCFIVYNTVAQGRQSMAPTLKPGGIVVNPLSWTTNGKLAPASLNIGSRFFYEDLTSTVLSHFTSAQVVNSGLVVVPEDLSMVASSPPTFPKGVYHVYDYSLFFENLRHNVGTRIKSFLNQ